VVMSIQGYLGGELVYRYGAEVTGEYRRLGSAAELRRRPKPGQRTGDEKTWGVM
jgi:hypothetical protein